MKINLLYFLLLLFAFSCDNCLTSTGEVIENNIIIAPFEGIIAYDNVSIYLDDTLNENEVNVVAGENIQKHLSFKVENKQLSIRNKAKCNWLRGYKHKIKIFVSSKTLKTIKIKDYSNLYTNQPINIYTLNKLDISSSGVVDVNLNTESLYLFSNGEAPIHLKGKTTAITIHTNGIGKVNAKSLQAKKCIVIHENINEILVYPLEVLEVTFLENSRGRVIYYNKPQQVIINRLGKGEVTQKLD